jgi:hypothetical protein
MKLLSLKQAVEAITFSRQFAYRWRWGFQPYTLAAIWPGIHFCELLSAFSIVLTACSALKLRGPSPRANYTDRATADCRRSRCQPLCHVVSVTDPYGRILGFLDRSRYFSIKQLLSCTHGSEWTPFQTHYFSDNLVAPGIEPEPLDM